MILDRYLRSGSLSGSDLYSTVFFTFYWDPGMLRAPGESARYYEILRKLRRCCKVVWNSESKDWKHKEWPLQREQTAKEWLWTFICHRDCVFQFIFAKQMENQQLGHDQPRAKEKYPVCGTSSYPDYNDKQRVILSVILKSGNVKNEKMKHGSLFHDFSRVLLNKNSFFAS